MKILLIISISAVLLHTTAFCGIKTVINNSSTGWDIASNWLPAGIPASGDTVIIPAGITIKVKGDLYSLPPTLFVFVYGSIDFDPSGKMNLAAGSSVQLLAGAKILSTGTSSEKITIGGVVKFSGSADGSISGPVFASSFTGSSPAGFAVGTVLPLKLLSFDHLVQNNKIVLRWNCITDDTEDYVYLEKMDNNGNWKLINTQKITGNAGEQVSGSYTDPEIPGTKTTFRLKIKNNTSSYYSKIIAVTRTGVKESFGFYPNPAKGMLYISLCDSLSPANLQVLNAGGKVVLEQNIINQAAVALDIFSLRDGIYTLCCHQQNHSISKSFIVRH